MTEAAPHPTEPDTGAGAFVLRLLLWLFILLAGFAVVIVLPAILVLTAMGEARPGLWLVYLWVPAIFLAGLFSLVAGLRGIAHPRGRRVALLAGIALAAFLSFPPFWLTE